MFLGETVEIYPAGAFPPVRLEIASGQLSAICFYELDTLRKIAETEEVVLDVMSEWLAGSGEEIEQRQRRKPSDPLTILDYVPPETIIGIGYAIAADVGSAVPNECLHCDLRRLNVSLFRLSNIDRNAVVQRCLEPLLWQRRSDADPGTHRLDRGGKIHHRKAVQLEGLGVHLLEQIEGDHFTIVGLPLLPLLGFPARRGFARHARMLAARRSRWRARSPRNTPT